MDKFFILRTLAASCVSLKKEEREKKNITQLQQQKVLCVVHELDFEKKVTAIICIYRVTMKAIGRWFYLSVAFFSLSHTLAHSFANIAFSFICTIISYDVLVATNLSTCPYSDDIFLFSQLLEKNESSL